MPREFEFEGSGHKGAAFELKGMEERNLTNLLKTLSNKTTQKSVEALAKIDKTEWKDIALVTTNLRRVVEGGGLSVVFGSIVDNIRETIELQIESLMAPLTNQINTSINDLINPLINDYLVPIVNNLDGFLSENSEGAGAGGIIGGIASLFLPGGEIWTVIGAIVGAAIQQLWESITEPTFDVIGEVDTYQNWLKWNPGGSFVDYIKWRRAGESQNSYLQDKRNTYGR